jgi:hypothetical protein
VGGKVDWYKRLNSSKSQRPYNKVQHLKMRDYEYDKNSTCPPPIPVPTAIMVSGLAHFATPEKLRSHFSSYGIIAEIDLKTDPATAGLLGICWIRYADQVRRKLYGPQGSYIREATGLQDGHLIAQEAIRRNHDKKVPTLAKATDKISVVMDGQGLLTKKTYESILAKRKALAVQKDGRKPALAAAAEITKTGTSSSSTPMPGRTTPDDPVRQRTTSATSSTAAAKSLQQPSSITPHTTLPHVPSLPNKPPTQASSNPPKQLSISLQSKSSTLPTGPRANQTNRINPLENVPKGPKALMSPTAPSQNRQNPLLTPTGTKFPPGLNGKLPLSAGASAGQRGPFLLATKKTPDKLANPDAESSSSSSEDSENENEEEDQRKKDDDDKIYFPRTAKAGQRIIKDTVESLSPVKESPPCKVSTEAIQGLRAKIEAFTRLSQSSRAFVSIVKSSLSSPGGRTPNANDLKDWMRDHRPTTVSPKRHI